MTLDSTYVLALVLAFVLGYTVRMLLDYWTR